MRRDPAAPCLVCLLGLLAVLLYPAIFLDRPVAPEASLRSVAPWRAQWGPQPAPLRGALDAATRLGPRLQGIARDGWRTAVWNPWIGGGRPGWLSSPAEGGAPLVVAAGLTARPGWEWTGLIALQVGVAFGSAAWALRRLGLAAWPACVGGVAYALSGAVASQALAWPGSAMALGPLALVPATMQDVPWPRRAAAWGAVLAILLASGAPAVQFVAAGLAVEALAPRGAGRPARVAALLVGLALAGALLLPSVWLDRVGYEARPANVPAPLPAPETPLRELLDPFAAAPAYAGGTAAGQGFLSTPVLLLAALGALLGGSSVGRATHRVWLGVLVAAALLAWAPPGLVTPPAALGRPFGALALATAVLAALGASAIAGRAPGAWRDLAVALIFVLLVSRLAPPFARRLPFAEPGESRLVSPVPTGAAGGRFVAILSAVPPDVGATLGAADARAADLRREPAYATRLGSREGGELPLARVLDRRLPDLGVRWLVEPLPLRVVSGEIFAHVETVEVRAAGGRASLEVPDGAIRVGVHANWANTPPALRQGDSVWSLAPDPTLSSESDAWAWFALPAAVAAGEAQLHLAPTPPLETSLTVAWDLSGLRVAQEDQGARVWEWPHAAPQAFFTSRGPDYVAADSRAAGRVAIGEARPSHLELSTGSARPGHVVVLVKHRPALWRARVDGVPAPTLTAQGVWTAVPVDAGAHRVVLTASLPGTAIASAACGLLGLVGLAIAGRRR